MHVRITLLAILLLSGSAVSEPAASANDLHALDAIFAAQQIPESSISLLRRTENLDATERLQTLSQWILPGPTHRDYRITVDFVANPINDQGRLVSPVIDWLQVADQLGQIEKLQQTVAAAASSSVTDDISKSALQLLLAMHRNDPETAAPIAKELFANAIAHDNVLAEHRDAVLLCLHQALASPDLARLVVDASQQLVDKLARNEEVTAWHQHLKATTALLRELVHATDYQIDPLPSTDPQWHAAVRSRSWEHGSGFPGTQWRFGDASVENLSSHGEDFLFFATPLEGNFEVEGDVSSFGWKDTQLFAAGTWVSLVYDLKRAGIGNFRGQHGHATITPPLHGIGQHSTVHYRAVVRDRKRTSYFSARQAQELSLSRVTNPWVGVRSSPKHDGVAADVRITGGVVPKTISLSQPDGLPGWYEHFPLPTDDNLVGWQQDFPVDPTKNQRNREITGPKDPALPANCLSESLLAYSRPMIEDGTITYDFWYAPGESMVHPALGRLAFLIQPQQVIVHPITDGKYDRTSARPDGGNVTSASPALKAPILKPNAWNQAALQLTRDELHIRVNGTIVHTQTLPRNGVRHFGLFHFNDQTTARARNVDWSGDWPKQLPPLDQQTLASLDPILQRSDSLRDGKSFTQKLNQQALDTGKFSMLRGDPAENFKVATDGITIIRPAIGNYCDARLTPNVNVEGDFDVTTAFDSFAAHSVNAPLACISLEVAANDSVEQQASIRMIYQEDDTQVFQCTLAKIIDGERRTEYFATEPIHASAGRLRLSRRGEEIIFQFAENDSEQFQTIGRRPFTKVALNQGSIRFGAQMMGTTGHIQARWTSLDLVAEKMNGLAIEDHDATLAELNTAREAFANRLQADFTTQPPVDDQFYRWGDRRNWNLDDGGLKIQHIGTDKWDSSGLAFMQQVQGDFDIAIEFDEVDLAAPKTGEKTQLFLQIELADQARSQVSSVFTRKGLDRTSVESQTRHTDDRGGLIYNDLFAADRNNIRRLRLVRRGKTIYSLAGTGKPEDDEFLAKAVVGDAPMRTNSLRALVHTGGAGRTSQIRLQRWDIRAESLTSLNRPLIQVAPAPNAANQPSAPPKSILQSIFDSF